VRTAKEFVGDKVIRFDPVMAAEGAARRQLGRALRMAARTPADHFYLEYQPQVDMRTGRLVCAEALIRWRDGSPEGGQPGSFLPLATEFGLMPELGQWIIEEACRTVKQWRATCEAVIAVNVDTQQLTADFADVVSAALRQTGAEAGWLMVEVTEAAAMGPDAQRQLDRIRALGVAISIDDFGTGFSSLSRLTDLPAQQMKIDKAFVTGLGQSNETLEIVRTIVALAHTLGMQLLAEGVESTAQARVLIDEGVDIAQGFLFGRAMPADECLQMWQHGVALPLALSKK
jgi:EAL domain-containing protein (putative c-di-GMP-specific phosphodiesterase class I)